MDRTNPKVDEFLSRAEKWQDESRELRRIILDAGLTEELKWGQPCYTFDKSNVVIIQGFKDYCAIMFFKGALLQDPNEILVAPGRVQAGRQVRFTNLQEIAEIEDTLVAYIQEAIEVEKAGLKVEHKKTSEYRVVDEFQAELDASAALRRAFKELTPGRQRGYLYYFSSAKQSSTRKSRVEKSVPRIMNGKGLNDP